MAFRFDKLTIKAQEAVAAAQSLAADRGHAQIEPLHLLAAMLAESDGMIGPLLDRIGVNRGQLEQHRRSPSWAISPRSAAARRRSPARRLTRVLEAAQREADAMKDEFVSTEHLLLALTKVDSKAKQRAQAQRHHREGGAAGPANRPRQHPGDRPDTPRPSSRPWNATASTWSSGPGRASSTR